MIGHHYNSCVGRIVMMLGLLAALGLFLSAANAASLGVVTTEGGMVEGTNVPAGDRYLDVFKGIPFAAPPGRFQKPVPHAGWSGVLETKDFGERCMQMNMVGAGTMGSEDCLYLNIWVPQGESISSGLPVMIYLFGGGFVFGSSQGANILDNYLYDGAEIANRGDVIVVTVNYRVGTLGFLSTGDSEIPGNYGLWDQQSAIGWVHRNIAAFGGDPDNITIFGESAGGASVNLQILSPHNTGLIRRAISQSGNALSSWSLTRDPRSFAMEVAEKVGCPTDEGMASCLMVANPSDLTLAGLGSMGGSPTDPTIQRVAVRPVIDGDFLPDEPSFLFGNAADIDYLVGVNNMDGHIYASVDVPSVNQPSVPTPISEVKELLSALTEKKGPEAFAAAFDQYTAHWGDTPDDETVKKTVVDVETDYAFLVPAQTSLYLHYNHANTARTYSYLFSEPNRLPLYPSWMGADHADDLQYVFGKPFSTPDGYLDQHRTVSAYMISYWTNFARTGDPNSGASEVPVAWPLFTGQNHEYIDINSSMNQDSVKQRLRTRFVYFWGSTYVSFPSTM